MTHIVIDLGEVPDHRATPPPAPAHRPPVPYRAVLGALSVVLLVLLAGAAYQRPPQAPTVIPARLGDTFYLDGDHMYLVGTGGVDTGSTVRDRLITTYQLPSARVLSRTTVGVAGTVVNVKQAGNTVIVGYQLDASGNQETVESAGGGRMLWRLGARFVSASAADGIALLSEADADVAIDLDTGRRRWQVPRPTDGFIAESGVGAGYPDWLVVLSDSGRLETWNAHTGRQLTSATVQAGTDRITGMIWPVSTFLLISTGAGDYDAYHLPDLGRLWRTPVDLSQSWMQSDCGTVICTFRQQRGMTVLDPVSGRMLWDSDRWAYAEPFGPYLLATAGADETDLPALWVLEPRTGQVLGNFGEWQALGPAGDSGLLYGKRDVRGKYKVVYGLLDPADRSVDVLGLADQVSGGCETSAGVMVCRLVDASVAIWRLG